MSVRTRFAPSPTGYLHVGGARTALFNYLYARHHGGAYALRVEDTDRERSTDESVAVILDGLAWLGLEADEGPVFQTQRFDRYAEVIDQLLSDGQAYHCYCTREELDEMRAEQEKRGVKARYDGRCRTRTEPREGVSPVVRFRMPTDGSVLIDDLVQGPIRIANEELDDLIIARSDGTPTYNLTVVVDDVDMKMTHVIRGDDHINNTPKQINIMQAMGAAVPRFAHLPMILGADGSRLSKRHGAVSVLAFREEGILPEALLNYLVRLGWSHGDREMFSLADMIELFDLDGVNKSAAKFDTDKLLWFNQAYIQQLPADRVAEELAWHCERLGIDTSNGPALVAVVEAFRERARSLADLAEDSRFLFEDFDEIDPKAAKKHLRRVVLEPLETLRERLAGQASWSAEALEATLAGVAEHHEIGMGKIGQPLRVMPMPGEFPRPVSATRRGWPILPIPISWCSATPASVA
ncbi:MAG: glutamate--tRNA ligase, partial [Pseudomonadota bacterium]